MRTLQIGIGKYLTLTTDVTEDQMSAWVGISTEPITWVWIRVLDLINERMYTPTLAEVEEIERDYKSSSFATKADKLLLWEIKKRLKGEWKGPDWME